MAATIPATSRDGVLTGTDGAAHSATLLYHQADHKLSGLMANGATIDVFESADHIIGVREGKRARPTFSVSAIVAAGLSTFESLILGETAAYVSVLVDIGDAKALDFSWTFPYGAETRTVLLEDCILTGMDKSNGVPMTASYSWEVLGAVTIDGVVVIAAR